MQPIIFCDWIPFAPAAGGRRTPGRPASIGQAEFHFMVMTDSTDTPSQTTRALLLELRNLILNGELASGATSGNSPWPRLNVSRTPVRAALQRLAEAYSRRSSAAAARSRPSRNATCRTPSSCAALIEGDDSALRDRTRRLADAAGQRRTEL